MDLKLINQSAFIVLSYNIVDYVQLCPPQKRICLPPNCAPPPKKICLPLNCPTPKIGLPLNCPPPKKNGAWRRPLMRSDVRDAVTPAVSGVSPGARVINSAQLFTPR